MSTFQRAKNTEEAFRALDPFALIKPGDPRFADFDAILAREHYGVSSNLKRHFRGILQDPQWMHIGIVGHKGTGKTTLVRKAMTELRSEGVMAVQIDAMLELDQGNFTFADMMLVVARSVIACVQDQNIEIDGALVQLIMDWFAVELLEEEHRKEITAAAEAKVGSGPALALLAEISATVTAALKSDNVYRQMIRRQAERNLAELVARVNALLDGVHAALEPRRQQLCVVFDNLEKFDDRTLVDRAVLRRADEFRQLRCHLLLFFSPADQYAPRTVQASQAFPLVTVPVLPVRFLGDPAEHVRPDAKRAVERLLDARLELAAVFADVDAAIEALARLSGGHVRDLLHLARQAGENAEPAKIQVHHIQAASVWLAGQRTILMREKDWPRAVEISQTNKVGNRDEDSHMLLHSCVLNYNGQPWWDVHPVIRQDSQFAAAARDD
ncbi:Type II secretory pathway, ATPase PulE/Tfp pilus assembly pathway, ATPase PilB [Enhygromyxa salina]|uniref:Type II secretory pathway, ATPase PulE/Tfp pilus assembly pathway, ATPase PilB n=1 Tax=Enhygromyxa salina TaxID=215803 RepID=A0A0C1Z302_9BACT|nr:AAA family ATPase [Enhygromyxa salina]KIG11934.1 Type II secretory pathway, ATPase PulE/Tfp pilus assembly pathway, ATPase PilB [Enhygromyxa salina]